MSRIVSVMTLRTCYVIACARSRRSTLKHTPALRSGWYMALTLLRSIMGHGNGASTNHYVLITCSSKYQEQPGRDGKLTLSLPNNVEWHLHWLPPTVFP